MIGSRLVSLTPIDKDMIHLFGGDHFGLPQLFLEDGVSEFFAFIEDRDFALNILADSDLDIAQGVGGTVGLDLVDHVLELDSEVLGNGARLLPGEDLVKVVVFEQRTVNIQ